MLKVYASKDKTRAIMVDDERGIIKAYGLTNVLCCEAYGEDGLIETEELERTNKLDFDWTESCATVYRTQDREAGNCIDLFETYEDAVKAIEEYEGQDKKDDCYEENFYEIVVDELLNLELIKIKYSMNVKQISDRFDIPYRTVQNWNSHQRECPQYIIKMMDEMLSKEEP